MDNRLFNIEEFDIKLDTDYLGRNFIYCEEIDSTNDYLMQNSKNLNNGTLLFAEFQTNGKGRKSREWISSKGQNLTFSILLNHNLKSLHPNILNLGASLSIAIAIENLYQLPVAMKWPNDVLIEDRKIAGILCEVSYQGKNLERIIIGLGININQPHFPGKYNFTPTSVKRELDRTVNREKFLSEFLNIFEETIRLIKDDPQKVLNDWREKCKMIGDNISVIENDSEEFGRFVNIDENGYIILKQGNEQKTIVSGDISIKA